MKKSVLQVVFAGLLATSQHAKAQPVDARAASQAFNHLTNRMEVLERKMDMLVEGWDLMLGSAVVGFNAPSPENSSGLADMVQAVERQ